MKKQYLRADDYVQDFNDDAWYDFHEANINNQDDFYDYLTQWIDNKVTYTFDARNICDNLEADVFAEHDLYGLAENWSQAGYNALYDCLINHDDTVTWADMRHEQLKSEIKAQAKTIAGVDFTDSLNDLKNIKL